MGKACGVSRRRKKNAHPRFKHKSKLAKAKKKLILRQAVKDPLIREAWDVNKSKSKNMANIGLADNPNKIIQIPKPIEVMFGPKTVKGKVKHVEPKRKDVLEKIEEKSKYKKPLTFHFGPELCQFLTTMMAKHGEDYKAMERDPDNHYLLSAGLLKRKIKQFLTNPITSEAYDNAVQSLENDIISVEEDVKTKADRKSVV